MPDALRPSPTTAPQAHTVDAVVLGAGVSGLVLARRLADAGKAVCVLDPSPQPGGAVRSLRHDGFLAEAGPNSMLVKSPEVWQFLADCGLQSKVCLANPAAKLRFLVRDATVHAMPHSPLSAITTPLYRFPEKLRVLAEPFIGKAQANDLSVTEFVSRRLGSAFLEYGIAALVSGIYAGNPDVLSIRHAFPKVWNLDQSYGGLIRGALGIRRDRRKAGIPPFKSKMLSFPDGLATLPQHLAADPRLDLRLDAHVAAIQAPTRPNTPWCIHADCPAAPSFCLHTSKLFSTIPAHALPSLPASAPLADALKALPVPDFPPVATLTLGFHRSAIRHPLNGFGALFPRREQRFALGVIFASSLFPNRAPDGHVCLMAFVGGAMQPQNALLPEPERLAATLEDLRPLLGIRGNPCFVHQCLWHKAIPQYNLGFDAWLAALDDIEARFKGLRLTGNFRSGPGLNDCILAALNTPI